MLLRQRVLDEKLVELPDLLAAKREHVDQWHELFDVEWVGLGQPDHGLNLLLRLLLYYYLLV